jgi:hypothetical protein
MNTLLAGSRLPPLETARYVDQVHLWPAEGRHILAHYDETSIVVYQAFRPEIGAYAVEHQQLGGGFKFRRMSWIKPSFLWMMYRSRWGRRPGQEMVLAVRIKRDFFDGVLAQAVPSEYDADLYPGRQAWREAVKTSSVRVQWDPDRGPEGAVVGEEPRLKRRAIQLGLRGSVLREYATSAIVEIIDLSAFLEAQWTHITMRNYEALSIPWQGVYVPADPATRERLKLAAL